MFDFPGSQWLARYESISQGLCAHCAEHFCNDFSINIVVFTKGSGGEILSSPTQNQSEQRICIYGWRQYRELVGVTNLDFSRARALRHR